jgi:hypothetical protein
MNSSKTPEKSCCFWHPTEPAEQLGQRCGNKLCQTCLSVPEGYCCQRCAPYVKTQRREKSPLSLALILAFFYGAVLILQLRDPWIILLAVGALCALGIAVLRRLPPPLKRLDDEP